MTKTLLRSITIPALIIAATTLLATGSAGAQLESVIDGVDSTGTSTGTVDGAVKAAISILSWVVGIIAVIMIIVSGLRFITSNGDASKVASARNGIIYALIGVVIVVLAQVIVRFAWTRCSRASSRVYIACQ